MYFSHEHVKSPATKSDIVAIVNTAAEQGQKVRVVGSGHSWSPVAVTEEILVSLWNYSGVVSGRNSARVYTANSALLSAPIYVDLHVYFISPSNYLFACIPDLPSIF